MKVLLTRPVGQNKNKNQKLQNLLVARGVQVKVFPLVDLVPLCSPEQIKQSWERWRSGEAASRYVVITSGQTVELLREAAVAIDVPVACLGIATAAAAKDAGWDVHHDGAHDARGLVAQLALSVQRAAIWWPGSAKADPGLGEQLEERGASVTQLPLYQPQAITSGLAEKIGQWALDAVVFFSASAVDAFADALSDAVAWPDHITAVCVGKTTAAAAGRRGLAPVVTAGEPTDEAVLEAISATFESLSAIMGASRRESHSE